MAAEEKNYGDSVEEIRRHEETVLRALYPEMNGSIEPGPLVIERSLGNPTAQHFLIRDKAEGREHAFCARFYATTPPNYKGKILPPEKDFQSYKFLKEAGINVPNAVFLKEAPNWLFTTHIPGETLRERIKTLEMKEKEKILEKLVEELASFQSKATKHAGTLPDDIKATLLWSRSVEEQSKDYFRCYLENRGEAEHIIKEFYMPLLADALRGDTVFHGDPSPDNLIYDTNGELCWIDPEIKRRHDFAGIGCFLSYLGNFEHLWDRLAYLSKQSKIEMSVERENGKFKGIPLLRIDEQGKIKSRFELYGNLMHYSLRRLAKIKRDGKNYSEQQARIVTIAKAFHSRREEFGISDEGAEKARKLEEIFSATINLDLIKPSTN